LLTAYSNFASAGLFSLMISPGFSNSVTVKELAKMNYPAASGRGSSFNGVDSLI